MIRLVVETPLADNKIGTRVLDSPDHIGKLLLFVFLRLLVFCSACDFTLMLRLWPWLPKGASQDRETSVTNGVRYLRAGHASVNGDTFDESGVCQRAANFSIDLDQIEGHILSIQVSNGHDGFDGNTGKLVVFF